MEHVRWPGIAERFDQNDWDEKLRVYHTEIDDTSIKNHRFFGSGCCWRLSPSVGRKANQKAKNGTHNPPIAGEAISRDDSTRPAIILHPSVRADSSVTVTATAAFAHPTETSDTSK